MIRKIQDNIKVILQEPNWVTHHNTLRQVPSSLDGPHPSGDSVALPPKSAGYSDCSQRDRARI